MHCLHILQQDTLTHSSMHCFMRPAGDLKRFQEALKYGEGVWETDGAKKTFEIIEKLASYTEKTTPANANDNDFRKTSS